MNITFKQAVIIGLGFAIGNMAVGIAVQMLMMLAGIVAQ